MSSLATRRAPGASDPAFANVPRWAHGQRHHDLAAAVCGAHTGTMWAHDQSVRRQSAGASRAHHLAPTVSPGRRAHHPAPLVSPELEGSTTSAPYGQPRAGAHPTLTVSLAGSTKPEPIRSIRAIPAQRSADVLSAGALRRTSTGAPTGNHDPDLRDPSASSSRSSPRSPGATWATSAKKDDSRCRASLYANEQNISIGRMLGARSLRSSPWRPLPSRSSSPSSSPS